VINAPNNSDDNIYINTMTVNGKPYDLTWLSHTALNNGAVINYGMSPKPNKVRGTKPSDAPYSLSNEK